MARVDRRSWVEAALLGLALVAAAPPPAMAISIELNDVAADRVERQRKAAVGQLPLAGTPDLAHLPERLREAGVAAGAPVFLRVFKATSELELWMRKDDAFVLFATYPICHWSGTLGPKLREGDRQTPEGFYTITARQLHLAGRWPRSLNLGFPNVLDKAQARHGSYILVHGGCSSTGCFAMTNPVSDEIYRLTEAALKAGQEHVPVHVFPFRMTEENLAAHQESDWQPFWRNLKDGYDRFETMRRPPRVSVCEGKYHFESAGPGEVGEERPLAVCAATAAALEALEQSPPLAPNDPAFAWRQTVTLRESLAALRERARSGALAIPTRMSTLAARRGPGAPATPLALASTATTRSTYACSLTRASCRKFAALQERRVALGLPAAPRARTRTAARGR